MKKLRKYINMSASFKERFKSRFSIIGKQGIIWQLPNKGIISPEPSKINLSSLVNSEKVLKGPKNLLEVKIKRNLSYDISNKSSRYIPYTLREYKCLRPEKYYKLGGLGLVSFESSGSQHKKKMYYKRNEYANQVNCSNILKLSENFSNPKKYYKVNIRYRKPDMHKRYASVLG